MNNKSILGFSSIICLLLSSGASTQPEPQIFTSAQIEAEKITNQESRVNGILLGVDGLPEAGTAMLLVEAQVWDLNGKPVPTLPAKGTSISGMISDSLGAIVVKGRSRTEIDGRFEFSAAPGRYGVAVATSEEKDAKLLKYESTQRLVVFDLFAKKDFDLGSVSRKKE